jgi:dienelactone hydrolase
MQQAKVRLLAAICCVVVSACSHLPTPGERRALADDLASRHGWRPSTLRTNSFELAAYLPATQVPAEVLTVFIEGDGLAWIDRSQPSSDPTPRDPLVLRLALKHPQKQSAYLARPCQYIDAETTGCTKQYWTHKRFSPEVIAATNNALDQLKLRFGATRLVLVGYSGGGAVAALVAVRRNDVERLITIAGNLDHRAWTRNHRILPLDGSLNPADEISALQKLPQLHFVGGKDRNITPELVQNFSQHFPEGARPIVMIEPEFDHQCCWVNHWLELWRKAMNHEPAN